MPLCKTCQHPERRRIEGLIVSGLPVARVAREHGLNRLGVSTHMLKHARRDMEAARKAQAGANLSAGQSLIDRVAGYISKAEFIMAGALEDKDRDAAVKALRAAHEILRTHGELTGELSNNRLVLQLGVSVEVAQKRLAVVEAARALPASEVIERALAVLERLRPSPTQVERMVRIAERAGRLGGAVTESSRDEGLPERQVAEATT